MVAGRHNLTRRALLGAGAAATVAAVSGAGATTTGSPGETPAPAAAPPAAPLVSHRSSPHIDIVCRECGGSNVGRDAWAEWDAEAQDWVLGSVFDDAHCHDCDRETRLEEVPLAAQDSPTG